MRVCVVLLLMLVSVPAHTQSPQSTLTLRSGIKFRGDEFDGLATGPKISHSGKYYIGLVQSQPNASPPPKEIASIVNGLIQAYLSHHPERYVSFVAPQAQSYVGSISNPSRNFLPDGFPLQLTGKVTANTPYYIRGMNTSDDVVRVEWLADGQLAALSWLNISGGKVVQVISDGAHPPPLPRSAYDPAEAAPANQ